MSTLRRLGWLALLLAASLAAQAQDDPFQAIRTADWQTPQPKDAILAMIRDADGNAAREAEFEAKLVAGLDDPATTLAGQYAITDLLWMLGTARSVPAVSKLLAKPELVDVAIYALVNNRSPEAAKALRDAVAKASGNARVALVQALGERRDATAVAVIQPLLTADAETARAAATALGMIGTKDAAQALVAAKTTAPVVRG